jgi:hypothetical protein
MASPEEPTVPEEPLSAPPGNEDNEANVAGRSVAPPAAGFGQLWRKQLSLTIKSAPPAEQLMRYWKEHLHDLWPKTGDLYLPHRGIQEGALLGIDLGVGPAKLSTGVLVTESTPTAFTLQSPEGHMFAGWNRFTTRDSGEGTTASVTIEMRASDPLYEMGLLIGGHRAEERFWAQMLWNLAERFNERPKVRLRRQRLDRRRQWDHARNISQNAFIRTLLRRCRRLLGTTTA